MDQLKFRAWDGEKIRYDVTGFEHGEQNEMAGVFLNGDYYAIRETPIMQFAGLLDCEGKGIYEQDILEVTSDNDGQKYITTFNCSLINGLSVTNSKLALDMGLYDYSVYSSNCRVIGNIYEHPNLLNNESSMTKDIVKSVNKIDYGSNKV
jgi:uncharacterized phage protein (TIGR01671 family)